MLCIEIANSSYESSLEQQVKASQIESKEVGIMLLSFSCRNSIEDMLYKNECTKFNVADVPFEMLTAFLRVVKEKMYMQHRLAERR